MKREQMDDRFLCKQRIKASTEHTHTLIYAHILKEIE